MTVDPNALYDKDAYEMDQRLGDEPSKEADQYDPDKIAEAEKMVAQFKADCVGRAPNTITVAASVVEAWSTGDADILESQMMAALVKAQEEITAEGSRVKRREIVIVVTA